MAVKAEAVAVVRAGVVERAVETAGVGRVQLATSQGQAETTTPHQSSQLTGKATVMAAFPVDGLFLDPLLSHLGKSYKIEV